MSVVDFLRFLRDAAVAGVHELRGRYYAIAHDHAVRNEHPDASMLCQRLLHSRGVVTDFIRKYTH